MNPRIVFQSSQVVIADKPAGWLTVPSRFADRDQRPVLGRILEKLSEGRLFPVHRLDQEVSGLVLFARTAEAQRRFNAAFERKTLTKTYHALTGPRDFSGWPPDLPRVEDDIPLGTVMDWHTRILRGKRRSYVTEQGDAAHTRAECLGPDTEGNWRWQLSPVTGRAHQLRLELARRGFPIQGDELYGSRLAWPDGIALRAIRLDFSRVDGRGDLPAIIEVKGVFP